MKISVEIDPHSGFCNGVVRAVETAQRHLSERGELNCLGAIVHNREEIMRLESGGLKIIDLAQMQALHDTAVLVRAHGEPPSTYSLARSNNIDIIDCTCPVVLALQRKISAVYEQIAPAGGQIVIFGKKGHAEVNGLVGQTDGNAIVIEGSHDLPLVDFARPVALFSQTTKDPEQFAQLCTLCRQASEAAGGRIDIYNTICAQVAGRHRRMAEFATAHDAVVFVSGAESSNGKVLYELCRSHNHRSYLVENCDMIDAAWFADGDRVGVCGATSTPRWQLEMAAQRIQALSYALWW